MKRYLFIPSDLISEGTYSAGEGSTGRGTRVGCIRRQGAGRAVGNGL